MPELAEVEYARKRWDAGLGAKISAVELHAEKRIFRGTDTRELVRRLTGAKLLSSLARGKQMLFRFSGDSSLGIHLGMSGSMRIERPEFRAEKHDHLVLRQPKRALVLRDPRQFGRVRFHHGKTNPSWWSDTPEIHSPEFTSDYFDAFLARHHRAPIKAVLLLQDGFPGIGNWMADEILWRAKVAPAKRVEALTANQRTALRRATRFVSREALRFVGHDDSDLPRGWLIHERWSAKGVCPRHKIPLRRATIGGRTTAWCLRCQPARNTR
jgi:formamidopyrimidine-DNA glycosylase